MIKIKLISIILILTMNYHCSKSAYIYLPDKLIQEEIPIGSFIIDLNEELEKNLKTKSSDLNDSSNNNNNNNNENQHYTFLDDVKTSTENTYFILDSITGRVTSKRYLDRESMCMNKHCSNQCDSSTLNSTIGNCIINIKVLEIPSYNIASLNIVIQDINDNKPTFRVDTIEQSIPENVPIGFKIPLDLAYDPDIGLNSIQSYKLIKHTNNFDLYYNYSQSELGLIVKEKLDREMIPNYNLTILACDGGQPANCGQLKLNINLIDINDNDPVFEKTSYIFYIDENKDVNTLIGRVKANDLDDGLNSRIKYTLLTNPNDNFKLDELNGELRLAKMLDYEKESYFNLNIEAKDSGIGSFPVYTNVEIYVNDLNDNLPEISVSFLNEFYRNYTNKSGLTIYINENIESNKFLAHVSISDKDSDEITRLEWKCYLNNKEIKLPSVLDDQETNNNLLQINKLNSNSFTINTGPKSNILFDREVFNSLNVSIMSTDRLNIAYYNFSIYLLDENDNEPKFDRDFYELNINENNYVDQLIHRFNAIDLDLNENGQVFYSIESLNNYVNSKQIDYVYIEPLTGFLRASKRFDREKNSYYEFLITARDNPKNINERKITKVKCRLNIIDLNDNRPIISFNNTLNLKNVTIQIDENIPQMTQIAKFNCHDADQGQNSETKFLIQNSYDSIPFKLSSDGRLFTNKNVDRELKSNYEFTIICHDSPGLNSIRLNTSIIVRVVLNDVNDNCPRNINPNKIEAKQFVNRKNLTKNFLLFNEIYTDDDDDLNENSKLKFELESHLDLFKIRVEEQTNKLFQLKIIVRNDSYDLKMGKYVLKMRITDMGNPSCVKNENFLLLVGDDENIKNETLLNDFIQMYPTKFINEIVIYSNNDKQSITNSTNNYLKSFAIYSFNKHDFLTLIGLIASLILIGSILSFIGLIFFCKNVKRDKKRKRIDLIKVRNYRQTESNLNNEKNNLIENDLNRLSLSFKSSDQSQSADSVLSNLTRETTNTSSNSSHNGDLNVNTIKKTCVNIRELYESTTNTNRTSFLSSFQQNSNLNTELKISTINNYNSSISSSQSSEIGDLIIIPNSSPSETTSYDMNEAINVYSLKNRSLYTRRDDENELDNKYEKRCLLYAQKSGYFNSNQNDMFDSNKQSFNSSNHYLRSSVV